METENVSVDGGASQEKQETRSCSRQLRTCSNRIELVQIKFETMSAVAIHHENPGIMNWPGLIRGYFDAAKGQTRQSRCPEKGLGDEKRTFREESLEKQHIVCNK